MTEQSIPLITFYQGWQTFHENLVQIIEPLSPSQLALPAAPHH